MDDDYLNTGRTWRAIDDLNPQSVADARRRWLSGDDAPNNAANTPWLKSEYTFEASYAPPAPVVPNERAGARSARVADTGAKPSRGPVQDPEALGEQVRTLKKELAAVSAENRLLKVGKERAHAELRKAEYEGEQALKTGAIVDASGVAGVKPEVRLLKQLKAKTRDLESEVKSKAQIICELGEAGKNVRVRELEVQTKTYLEEARRLKEVGRLQAAESERALQNAHEAHAAAVGQKEAQLDELRRERQRMRNENAALDEELGRWMDENEMLREQVGRLEAGHPPLPPASAGGGAASVGGPPAPPSELAALRGKLKELQARNKGVQKERERAEADKVAIFAEMNEAVQKIEAELRTERAKAGRAEKVHQRTREDLALAHAEVHRLKARIAE